MVQTTLEPHRQGGAGEEGQTTLEPSLRTGYLVRGGGTSGLGAGDAPPAPLGAPHPALPSPKSLCEREIIQEGTHLVQGGRIPL